MNTIPLSIKFPLNSSKLLWFWLIFKFDSPVFFAYSLKYLWFWFWFYVKLRARCTDGDKLRFLVRERQGSRTDIVNEIFWFILDFLYVLFNINGYSLVCRCYNEWFRLLTGIIYIYDTLKWFIVVYKECIFWYSSLFKNLRFYVVFDYSINFN